MLMEKHFVQFFSPGTFVSEHTIESIDSWDVHKAIELSKAIKERHGARPYGFRFFTKSRSDDELDSKITNCSGMYYINGIVKTLEEMQAERNQDNHILISNMEINGWDKVVMTYTPYEWVQPFYAKDSVVTVE